MSSAKEKYDLVVPLGVACACSQNLRDAGLQLLSFPLDWIAFGSPRARANALLDGFDDILSESRLRRLANDAKDVRHDHYEDAITGFWLLHDFPKGRPLADSLPEIREKFARRTRRLHAILAASRRVLLVWLADSRQTSQLSADDARDCLDLFSRRFPNAHFTLLALNLPREGRAPARPPAPARPNCETFPCGQNLTALTGRGASPMRPPSPVLSPTAPARSPSPPSPPPSPTSDIRIFTGDFIDLSGGTNSWMMRQDRIAPFLRPFSVRDYRTRAEKNAFRARKRAKARARFGDCSLFKYLMLRVEYRLMRHLRKSLMRKGVRLD